MFLLLIGCVSNPAVDGNDIVVSAPGTDITTSGADEENASALANTSPYVAIQTGNQGADKWSYTWLEFDFNTGSGDYEDELTVLLSDGSWYLSHNGWFEIGVYNPLTITMVVSAQDRYVYSANEVRDGLTVEMITEEGDAIGEMIPVEGMAEYSATYIPPE